MDSGDHTTGYELEFEDTFEGDSLDDRRWLPYYLPQWSSRAQAAARYRVGDGCLRLLIEADQQPWCPELDGDVRVSSLQTAPKRNVNRPCEYPRLPVTRCGEVPERRSFT